MYRGAQVTSAVWLCCMWSGRGVREPTGDTTSVHPPWEGPARHLCCAAACGAAAAAGPQDSPHSSPGRDRSFRLACLPATRVPVTAELLPRSNVIEFIIQSIALLDRGAHEGNLSMTS